MTDAPDTHSVLRAALVFTSQDTYLVESMERTHAKRPLVRVGCIVALLTGATSTDIVPGNSETIPNPILFAVAFTVIVADVRVYRRVAGEDTDSTRGSKTKSNLSATSVLHRE